LGDGSVSRPEKFRYWGWVEIREWAVALLRYQTVWVFPYEYHVTNGTEVSQYNYWVYRKSINSVAGAVQSPWEADMADTKITVPIEIAQPAQPAQQERPEWARKSLHNVKMGQHVVRETAVEPQWGENPDGSTRLTWRPPTPEPEPAQPSPLDYARAQLNDLQSGVNNVMSNPNQISGSDQGEGYGVPDPLQFDMWDPEQAADYNQRLNAHIAQEAARRVNDVLEPHRAAMQIAQHENDYNQLAAEHADNPHFRDIMKAALHLMKEDPKLSMPKAFETAADPKNAKLGAKGNANLPERLRTGRNVKFPKFGQILLHNLQSGRSGR
jgi:hypothetical protein